MAKINCVALILVICLTFLPHEIHSAAINSGNNSEVNEKKSVQIRWVVIPEHSKEAHDLRSLLLRNEHTEEKKSLFDNAVHTIPGLDLIVQKLESAFQSTPSPSILSAGQNLLPDFGNLGGGGGGIGGVSSLFGNQAVIERPGSSGVLGGISTFFQGLEEKGQNLFSGSNPGPGSDQGLFSNYGNYGMQPQQQHQQQQQPGLFGGLFGGGQSPGLYNQGYSQQMGFNQGQGQGPMVPNIQGPGIGGMGPQSQYGVNQIPPVRYPQQPGASSYFRNINQPQPFQSYLSNIQNENSPKLRIMSPLSEAGVEQERNEKVVKIYRVLPLFNSYRALPVSKEEV